VIEVGTDLEPHILFLELKQIERKAGRRNYIKWAEREIDIDILFYGKNVIRNDTLEIPHREIRNRRFVLVPLVEIAANFIHPVFKKSAAELLSSTNDVSVVCRYKTVV
jgi:2-amino-4-hydroxy-6-hydroxymethyldihydropteridine diphosphokinase